jgi:hypothetical protein
MQLVNLKSLWCGFNENFTDKSLAKFSKLKNLDWIDNMYDPKFSPKMLDRLRKQGVNVI